jgi:hypothetical protein
VAVVWFVDLDVLLDESLLGRAASARLHEAYNQQRAQWERVANMGTSDSGRARAAAAAEEQERQAFAALEQQRVDERNQVLVAVRDAITGMAPPNVVVVDKRAILVATSELVDATKLLLEVLDGSFLA